VRAESRLHLKSKKFSLIDFSCDYATVRKKQIKWFMVLLHTCGVSAENVSMLCSAYKAF